jgi:hypothetical protein
MAGGTFRPDSSRSFVHGHEVEDDDDGEVLDEIDVILAQMRDKAANSAREALARAGEAAGTVVIAEGIRRTKPLADLAAGFGVVLGEALAGAILGTRRESTSSEEEDVIFDSPVGHDEAFYDEEDTP